MRRVPSFSDMATSPPGIHGNQPTPIAQCAGLEHRGDCVRRELRAGQAR